jgi:hypothetical protein
MMVTAASITASATLPFCSFIAGGFHPLCSIDSGDTPYQEGRALFRKSLGGISEDISIRRILSQRYQRDSYPGLCNLASHLLYP